MKGKSCKIYVSIILSDYIFAVRNQLVDVIQYIVNHLSNPSNQFYIKVYNQYFQILFINTVIWKKIYFFELYIIYKYFSDPVINATTETNDVRCYYLRMLEITNYFTELKEE